MAKNPTTGQLIGLALFVLMVLFLVISTLSGERTQDYPSDVDYEKIDTYKYRKKR